MGPGTMLERLVPIREVTVRRSFRTRSFDTLMECFAFELTGGAGKIGGSSTPCDRGGLVELSRTGAAAKSHEASPARGNRRLRRATKPINSGPYQRCHEFRPDWIGNQLV